MNSLFSAKLKLVVVCIAAGLLSMGALAATAAAAPEPPAPAAPAAKPAAPEPPAPAAKPAAPEPPAPAVKVEPAPAGPAAPASATVDEELAVCPGQTFLQPFTQDNDDGYYTLVEGSEFTGSNQGWQLMNGAEVVQAERPDGSSAGVLNLPAGAVAISPPVCVTLSYPSARTWVESTEKGGGVTVGVYYGSVKTGITGQPVAQLNPKPKKGWELSNPFNVMPQLGALLEGVREAHFVYANTTREGGIHVFGLYVDPRMH